MTKYVHLNGAMVSEKEAHLDVYDAGFLHGAGLFETMRAENGFVFRLQAHLDRLMRSADQWQIPIRREDLPAAAVCEELLNRNQLKLARLRLTVTAGSVSTDQPHSQPSPTILLTVATIGGYPSTYYQRGVSVAICDYQLSLSDPLAGHKTTCYFPRLLGLRQAHDKHCVEALWFTTTKQLAEGCLSNVFIVRDGVIKTPPLDTPVLPGIARSVVLELASTLDQTVKEDSLTIDDLLDADEVFLTNSIMQVMPVTRVERHDINKGKIGSITVRLLEAYRNQVKQECQPS